MAEIPPQIGTLSELERRFAEVKPITDRPDWSANATADDHPAVSRARAAAGRMLTGEPGECGLVMRGMTLAIADHFPARFLVKGMASTMRGVRNAFARRWLEIEAGTAPATFEEPDPGFIDERDLDAVAFLVGEAAAKRTKDPAGACVLARAAKALADQAHREHGRSSEQLPRFESALPTHDERVWGKPLDERIVQRLDEWITAIAREG